MLRTIFTCFIVLTTLTKQTVISTSLDGGLAYITKHLNKQNTDSPMTPSRDITTYHTSQSVDIDQDEIPASRPKKAPVFQKIPLLPRGAVTTSFSLVVPDTTSTYRPKSILQVKAFSEPAKMAVFDAITIPQETTTVTPAPFIISVTSTPRQEIAIVAPKYISASRIRAQQFPKPSVSLPLTGYSTVVPSCPLETTVHVEQQRSRSTTTTTTTNLPTTISSTTTIASPSPCRNGEIFPINTGSCDQFLMCHNSVIVLMICPQGMGFDIQKNRCEWSQVVPACKAQGTENKNN